MLVGRTNGSDGSEVGSGGLGRMTPGIVDRGRADPIGSGARLGAAAVSGTFGTGTATGTGRRVGSGTRVGAGARSGNTVITGSGSGAAVAKGVALSVGTGGSVGASVAAARGAGAVVHATDAISAMTTKGRTANSPPGVGHFTGQPDRPRGALCIGPVDRSKGPSLG